MSALGPYRLLTPYLLAGFSFSDEADEYVSQLGVTDLTAVSDETASVFTGMLEFGAAQGQQWSGKAGFRWDEIGARFRLTVPRDGALFINSAAAPLTQLAGLPDEFQSRIVLPTAVIPTGDGEA